MTNSKTEWMDTNQFFEELKVGESREIKDARTITETDIVNFAGLSGDFVPLHMSKAYAEQTQFGERIAHGNLVFSITEGLIAELNAQGVASLGHDNLRYRNPVFIGDTLSVRRELVEKQDHDDDHGRVVYEYETTNQHGETVCTDNHIQLIKKRR